MPLQFALGQSVSAAFSASFVCSCCKHMCDYVTYLSISFICHTMLQSYNHQLIIVGNGFKTLREMSNFVEFTGPWYSTTLGES